MVNRDFGWVSNMGGTKKAEIKVNFPDKMDKNIIIGLGLIGSGIILLSGKSIMRFVIGNAVVWTGVSIALTEMFYSGANQFWRGETKALIECGILDGDIEDFIF